MKFKALVRALVMMLMTEAPTDLRIARQRDRLIIKLLKQRMNMILKKAIIRLD